ncbi:STAS domain-containing protein [Baekduia soli]|nr:STAS domain-containing protein [Baekduia soli]
MTGAIFHMSVFDEETPPRLVLEGDVDISALSRARGALRGLLAAAPPVVVVDLSAVDLLETTTVGWLVRERIGAVEQGTSVVFVGAQPVPRRLIEMAEAVLRPDDSGRPPAP